MSVIFFVFGILIGSFLNVCAIRIPQGEPIIWGGVHCSVCELVTGVSFLLAYSVIGVSTELIPALILTCILIMVSLIDFDYKIIPNKLVGLGIIIGIPINLIFARITWREMLWGLLAGGGFILLIALLSRGGMGGGDVKFTAMLGIYLGWQSTLETIFLASLLGAFVGIGLLLTTGATRKTPIPFGPFLALSAYILYLWGPEVNNWYWAIIDKL